MHVLNEPDRKAQNKSYMWVIGVFNQQPALIFHYFPTLKQQVPLDLLSTATHAIIIDSYQGYESACVKYDIQHLGCWAHAHRKFYEAKKAKTQNKIGKAEVALSFIQKPYAFEQKTADLPPDKRQEIRQLEANPIIEKFKEWLDKTLLNTLPDSLLGKALSYTTSQWQRLVRYTSSGHFPIDNNLAENAIRPFVVGRKNWLFANSPAGANASSNFIQPDRNRKS